MPFENIKHIILVLSGKGGVGKSSVTTQLALSLAAKGKSVGVLDIDLTGPSMPRMFGAEAKTVVQGPEGWLPVSIGDGKIKVMSLGFLLNDRGDSVVWRGPKKTAMVRQFCTDVAWGPLDYLIIDTPPGTSDEHISIAEQFQDVKPDGAVVVTTPQAVATADVRKELNFCKKVEMNVLGIIENMSGYVCPHCAECTNIFSSGGGKVMAEEFDVEFLGSVPIDPKFGQMIETQKGSGDESLLELYQKSGLYPVFTQISDRVIEKCEAK